MSDFGPLVDGGWLGEHCDDDGLVVVDVRWYLDGRSGLAAYESGHIRGALFADLDSDLSAPPSVEEGRHPLPEPAAFAAAMESLGINDHSRVVAYDDTGGITAGRLWWMLDVLGHEVAVLDGGLSAWRGPLSTELPAAASAAFTADPWPVDRLVTSAELCDALGTDLLILDARSTERYERGAAVDQRPGHVPGALSAPATDNFTDGMLASPDSLAERYGLLGAADRSSVAYCGSGVSACIDLLALRHAGLPDGRLFVGSWSAWGADQSLPTEQGPSPP